jgi:hypothetical protein
LELLPNRPLTEFAKSRHRAPATKQAMHVSLSVTDKILIDRLHPGS